MDSTVEEIISAAKAEHTQQQREIEAIFGKCCDDLRGFIETARGWKNIADEAFSIDIEASSTHLFTARSLSLSILTSKILETALDIAGLLQTGMAIPAMVSWRIMSEAKNTALLIDLDIRGQAGFLWLHHGVIEQAKMMRNDQTTLNAIEQGKRILARAGFAYDSKKRDPWALGIDGKIHSNAVDRCRYVWTHRKFPLGVDQNTLSLLESAEIEMIKQSNAVAHATLNRSMMDFNPHLLLLTAFLDPMAVMLAYKTAASDLKLWPVTGTVGEQFQVYPPEHHEAREMSSMVMELYEYCLSAYASQFLQKEHQV